MPLSLDSARRTVEKATQQLLSLPSGLPTVCLQAVAGEFLHSETQAAEIAALLRSDVGQKLFPATDKLAALEVKFYEFRKGTLDYIGLPSLASLRERSSIEAVLQSARPRLFNPLSDGLTELVGQTAEKGLAQALISGVTSSKFAAFAKNARNVADGPLNESGAALLIENAKQVLRPDFLDKLKKTTGSVDAAARCVDLLQQKAKSLGGAVEADAETVLQNLPNPVDKVIDEQASQAVYAIQEGFENIIAFQEIANRRLAAHQQSLTSCARQIGDQVSDIAAAVARTFESANTQLKKASSISDVAFQTGQGLLAQASQAREFLRALADGNVSTEDLTSTLDFSGVQNLGEIEKIRLPLAEMQQIQSAVKTDLAEVFENGGAVLTQAANVAAVLGVQIPPQTIELGKAALAAASGNYIAAIGALAGGSNLLGGIGGTSGPDPVVMSQLSKIDGKLNQVLENQTRMIAQLNRVEAKLDDLRAVIVRNQAATMDKLNLIIGQLRRIQAVLDEQTTNDLFKCTAYVRNEDPSNVNERGGYWEQGTYEQVKTLFDGSNELINPFRSCLRGIESIFVEQGPSTQFSYSSIENVQNPAVVQTYLDQVDSTFTAYLKGLDAQPEIRRDQVAKILQPAVTVDELERKYAANPLPSTHPLIKAADRVIAYVDSTGLLRADRVLNAALRTMAAVTIYPFVKPESDGLILLTLEEIRDERLFKQLWGKRQPQVSRLLDINLDLLNIAIAQQTILSGDSLIRSQAAAYALNPNNGIPDSIKAHPLLLRNFVLYLIRRQLLSNNRSFFQYSSGYLSDQATFVHLFRAQGLPDLPIVRESYSNWYLIDKTNPNLKLPSPTRLESGILELSNELSSLVRRREQLANMRAENTFHGDTTDDEKALITTAAVLRAFLDTK